MEVVAKTAALCVPAHKAAVLFAQHGRFLMGESPKCA